ncbi:(deoxy)nucleoside triphosphate pyrophosphohydrolase [Altererythrobacter aquiaggeris]|uniref:(deoxy)nucleoside triphosphate pyrophosphohydrolase n=1 Tax=Aestuarierythrobacter aquiaggeris TaxID=1898396 RepID=UPI0030176F3B
MKKIPTWVPVVAAAITGSSGKILLHQRPAGKDHAGLWEFPGGKVEPGETPAEALVREIAEELGIKLTTDHLQPAGFAQGITGSGGKQIVILLYTCRHWKGDPQAMEGNEWGWFTQAQAAALAKPPLDVELLGQLGR